MGLRIGVLLALILTGCVTMPTPTPGPSRSSEPTNSPTPTPFPSPSPLAGEVVGLFAWSPSLCNWLLFPEGDRENLLFLRLHRRYDVDLQLGRFVIIDRDGTVVAAEADRIGVNGELGQLGGGYCVYSGRVLRNAVIVDVDPAPAPYTLRESKRGVRYPLTIYTHCGLRPVQLLSETTYWDFEGPTGDTAPEGFADPYDVGIVVFHDRTHATYTSSGGVSVDLRELSWRDPDPSFTPCPVRSG